FSINELVVLPIADTTTTTFLPAALVRAIRLATRRIFSMSATDEPPYFWTTMPVGCTNGTLPSLRSFRSGGAATFEDVLRRRHLIALIALLALAACRTTGARHPIPADADRPWQLEDDGDRAEERDRLDALPADDPQRPVVR